MGKYSLSSIIHKLKYKDYINKDEFLKLQQAQKAYNALPKIVSRVQDLVNTNVDYDEYHNGKDIAYLEVLTIIQEEAGDLVCSNRSPEQGIRETCENCKYDRKECGNDDHYGFCKNWELKKK